MNIQENPTNGIRDTAEKTVCLSTKMTLSTDWSEPNLYRLFRMLGVCSVPHIQFKNVPETTFMPLYSTIHLNDKIRTYVTDITL